MVAPVVQPRAQPYMHAAAVALIRVVAVAAGGEAELAVEFSARKGGRGKASRGSPSGDPQVAHAQSCNDPIVTSPLPKEHALHVEAY